MKLKLPLAKRDITHKIDCIRLIRSENIGPKTFMNLVSLYGSPKIALEQVAEMSLKGGRAKPIVIASKAEAEKELEEVDKYGASIITYQDNEYPELLKEIDDFPPVLTILGRMELLGRNQIAIVGARNSSLNGCKFAEKLAEDLGKANLIITSGLARGIDTAAHKASLISGTIAVVAGGINKIYPPENERLYRQIVESGAIIAELPIGTAPKAQNFPQRNRIISGLSLGTVIVEASLGSGSLITARMALEQNREVFAVPGFPYDPRCQGTNKLLKQGANLVESARDIIDVLENKINNIQRNLFERKKSPFNNLSEQNINNIDEKNLQIARKDIVRLINSSPVEIDAIISQTEFEVNIVLTILLELELAGKLQRLPGNKVILLF